MKRSKWDFCRPFKEFGFQCMYNEKVFEGLKQGITSVLRLQNIISTAIYG